MRKRLMEDDVLEDYCMKLPRKVIQAFKTITTNKDEDPSSVIVQLLQSYVDRHRDVSMGRGSGIIEVYVKSILNQWIDWAPAKELEADEFIELTVGEIHKKLVVNSDQARMVAFRVWQELRNAPEKGDTADGNATDDHGTGREPA